MLSLTPSLIIEYLFCPRFTYFEYVLRVPQYEDRHYKVRTGRDVHDQKSQQNIAYLRRRLGVKEKYLNQYLTNDLLRGKVDEILLLEDNTMAPMDYKFAKYEGKVYETYQTQLFCYAWLIEHNYGKRVEKGFLIYTRSKNKLLEVAIKEDNMKEVQKAALAIQDIMTKNNYPRATKYKKRCVTCTYRNICTK